MMGTQQPESGLIPLSVVARYPKYLYPLHRNTIARMFRNKVFKTATKLGSARNSHWYVSPIEVLDYKMSRHNSQLQDR